MLGTQVTDFALGVWMYEKTGSATLFALLGFATLAPQYLFSPLIGIVVDRINHRSLMFAGHIGAAFGSVILGCLYWFDGMHPWHLIVIATVSSIFNGVLFSTLTAATIHMVPADQLTRMQGLVQGGFSVIQISAPALAGFLFLEFGLRPIFVLQMGGFSVAVSILFFIVMDRSTEKDTMVAVKASVFENLYEAWRYLLSKPGLMAVELLMAVSNAVMGIVMLSLTPLVLSFSDSQNLGLIYSTAGMGMLCGSLFMMHFGRTQYNVQWLLIFNAVSGAALLFMVFKFSIPLLMFGAFAYLFGRTLVLGSYQSLLQRKIHPDIQGRTLGLRTLISGSSLPLGYIIAGPIADYLSPMMMEYGVLADSAGGILGVGPGRGVALLACLAGSALVFSSLVAAAKTSFRTLETRLPDYGFKSVGD